MDEKLKTKNKNDSRNNVYVYRLGTSTVQMLNKYDKIQVKKNIRFSYNYSYHRIHFCGEIIDFHTQLYLFIYV